jgi:hypothetical protein
MASNAASLRWLIRSPVRHEACQVGDDHRALIIMGRSRDRAFEGVDGQQPGCLPVGGAVAALAVVLQAGQLPAVGAEPVSSSSTVCSLSE